MRHTPKRVSTLGALAATASARARVVLVAVGSMIPSSHSRLVANCADEAASSRVVASARNASISSLLHAWPDFFAAASFTCSRTLAACSPPMTAILAFGHIHMKRGEKARPHMP